MDAKHFDHLVRSLSASGSRRGLLALLAGAPVAGALLALLDKESAAKDRRRRRKTRNRRGKKQKKTSRRRLRKQRKKTVTLCHDGQTIRVRKAKRQEHLRHGDTRGPCQSPPPPPCTPSTCPANANCGTVPNVCGGTISCGGPCSNPTPVCASNVCTACADSTQCPTGSVCKTGSCVACTVRCDEGDHICDGTALQDALAAGGDVYVCPGRYTGNFTLNASVDVAGAGEGDDPASNTILDATNNGTVVQVPAGVAVGLQRLRITGGNEAGQGGVISAGDLTMTACTVVKNASPSNSGGLRLDGGTMRLVDCTVAENTATGSSGGGIFVTNASSLTLDNTLVYKNSSVNGGGISVNSGNVDITNGSQIRKNIAAGSGGGLFVTRFGAAIVDSSSFTENEAATGGGIFLESGGTVTLNDATVSGNSEPQCVGLTC